MGQFTRGYPWYPQNFGELQTPVSQGLAPASACEESRTSVPGAIGDHRGSWDRRHHGFRKRRGGSRSFMTGWWLGWCKHMVFKKKISQHIRHDIFDGSISLLLVISVGILFTDNGSKILMIDQMWIIVWTHVSLILEYYQLCGFVLK